MVSAESDDWSASEVVTWEASSLLLSRDLLGTLPYLTAEKNHFIIIATVNTKLFNDRIYSGEFAGQNVYLDMLPHSFDNWKWVPN